MASTVTLDANQVVRNRKFGAISLGNPYASGGIAVTPQQFGFSNAIQHLQVAPSGGYVFEYVPSTKKVKAYLTGASLSGVLAEAGAADLSGVNARFEAVGY